MIIVIINNENHPETRCWSCNNLYEASHLVKWLSDNYIESKTITTEEYNQLVKEFET